MTNQSSGNLKSNECSFEGILLNKINELINEETKISLPRSPEDCNKILRTIKHDFDKYISQIKAMLKTYRSKAHYISIYRDLVMERE
jgi:hypothetical protein